MPLKRAPNFHTTYHANIFGFAVPNPRGTPRCRKGTPAVWVLLVWRDDTPELQFKSSRCISY